MSSSPRNHRNPEIAKAYNIIEAKLKSKLLRGHKYISPSECQDQILSLSEDLRTFVQENSNHRIPEIAKAYTTIEFTLENLKLLLGHKSISSTECQDQILSLSEELKYMRKENPNHKIPEIAKAYTTIEFTLENLKLLQGHKSISPSECQDQILSLSEDFKYMRTFLERVQENSNHKPTVSDLIADIILEVGELLYSTDFYVHRYMFKRVKNFHLRTSLGSFPCEYFLSRSEDLLRLVEVIKVREEALYFSSHGGSTGGGMSLAESLSDQNARSQPAIESNVTNHEELTKPHIIVELALQDLDMLLSLGKFIPVSKRDQLSSVYADLEFLGSFIKRVEENSYHYRTVSVLLDQIVKVVGELLDIMDTYLDSPIMGRPQLTDMRGSVLCSPKIPDLVKKIKSVEEKVFDVLTDGGSDGGGCSSVNSSSTRIANSIAEEKVVIGMEDKTRKLLNRLIGGWKQLEVIPVIGMAGIGKTTLARKLYNDPSIACHFHFRAWTSVSLSYQKRKLLRDILSSIVGDNDPVLSLSEEDIGEKLYKCLKGNRYLIVLDDIWDVEVWFGLQIYLPKDNNSSRVFITSRNKDVIPKIMPEIPPHFLRFLTKEESWDLLRYKAFGDKSFSEELMKVGQEIVATCKGLPIAVVVVAGVLAKEEKTKEKWTEISKTIRSASNSDLEQVMDILALSYTHLPLPLKPCFLYLGAFPQDYEFSAKCLVRSWIAEGFIQHTAGMKLEDIAEGYLMNLINRSVLIVARRRSDGGIKSCQIHDLLRDLCIKKAGEKKYLQPIYHFYDSHFDGEYMLNARDSWTRVKLLRVLDLKHFIFHKFPEQIFELLHLKCLALQVDRIERAYRRPYLSSGT